MGGAGGGGAVEARNLLLEFSPEDVNDGGGEDEDEEGEEDHQRRGGGAEGGVEPEGGGHEEEDEGEAGDLAVDVGGADEEAFEEIGEGDDAQEEEDDAFDDAVGGIDEVLIDLGLEGPGGVGGGEEGGVIAIGLCGLGGGELDFGGGLEFLDDFVGDAEFFEVFLATIIEGAQVLDVAPGERADGGEIGGVEALAGGMLRIGVDEQHAVGDGAFGEEELPVEVGGHEDGGEAVGRVDVGILGLVHALGVVDVDFVEGVEVAGVEEGVAIEALGIKEHGADGAVVFGEEIGGHAADVGLVAGEGAEGEAAVVEIAGLQAGDDVGGAEGGLEEGGSVGVGEVPVEAAGGGEGRAEGLAAEFALSADEAVGGGEAGEGFADGAVVEGDLLVGGVDGQICAGVEEGSVRARGVGAVAERGGIGGIGFGRRDCRG